MDNQQETLRKLGRRVTELRRQKDLALDQLSARSGLDSSEIAAIEAGQVDPTVTMLLALCRGLGIPPGELLHGG